MAIVSRAQIKQWFRTRLKPTQAQYWDTWDSFWHKQDSLPTSQITNLDTILASKASNEALNNAVNNLEQEIALLGGGNSADIFFMQPAFEAALHLNYNALVVGTPSMKTNIAMLDDDVWFVADMLGVYKDESAGEGTAVTNITPAAIGTINTIDIKVSKTGTKLWVAKNYGSTQEGKVFYSPDHGATWNDVTPNILSGYTPAGIEISENGVCALVGTWNGECYMTKDNGASWVKIAGIIIGSSGVMKGGAISNDGNHIILPTMSNQIMYSTDGGVTFTDYLAGQHELYEDIFEVKAVYVKGDKLKAAVVVKYPFDSEYKGKYLVLNFAHGLDDLAYLLTDFADSYAYWSNISVNSEGVAAVYGPGYGASVGSEMANALFSVGLYRETTHGKIIRRFAFDKQYHILGLYYPQSGNGSYFKIAVYDGSTDDVYVITPNI